MLLNWILTVAEVTTLWIFVFIVLLLFNELGIFNRVHNAIKRNSKLTKLLYVFGETLYGVGISVVGSVLFAAAGLDVFSYKILMGIGLIAIGAYIKK